MEGKNNTVEKSWENIDTVNIFEEFLWDSHIEQEVEETKKIYEKDKFYYYKIASDIVKYIFLWLILVWILLHSYIYFQKNENALDVAFLDPICHIFIWKTVNYNSACSSIASLQNGYQSKITELKSTQYKWIVEVIETLYQLENFHKTKEVNFLLHTSKNKLDVLQILQDFDDLKNKYTSIEKEKIDCYNLSLESDQLSMTCDAYSASFRSDIIGYEAGTIWKVSGTSISLANSFINYLELNSDIFTLMNRQKTFTLEEIVWDKSNYTNKTTFNLLLKYNYE